MATTSNQDIHIIEDFSGGVQRVTTIFQARENEVDLSINATYERIGGVQKIKGTDQKGSDISTTSTTSTSTSTSTTSTSTSTSTSSSTSSSTSTSSTTTA